MMKKFLMGVLVGTALMFSTQIFASTKLLGNQVDNTMNVKLEDKDIGQAAVIDGTSYIPVRALADELKLKVSVSTGEIILSNPTANEYAQQAGIEQEAADNQAKLNNKKVEIQRKIDLIKVDIASDQEIIAINQTKLESPYKEIRDVAQKNIDKLNQSIADNQTKLIQWESELADVNAQIAALETQGK